MRAGGWSDYTTFANYIRTTDDDVREAVTAPRVDVILPKLDGTVAIPSSTLTRVRRCPPSEEAR